MARLAVARLHVCSNSFNPRATRLGDLAAHEWRAGASALAAAPAGSELDGVAAFLAARPGWSATVLRAASAPPSGALAAEAFAAWLADVEAGLRAGRFDAVYLSLHGAAQAEGDPAADLTILRRVRALVGRLPVVASFDPAANLSDEVPLLLDGASGGRGWPGDGEDAAQRALTLLEGLLAGRHRPVGALARVASLRPSLTLPLRLSELWEQDVGRLGRAVLEAGLFAGFPWSDMAHAGGSALVWTDRDAGLARATAERLAGLLGRAPGGPALWQPDAALAAGRASRAPFALLDPADDPVVGGLADTPGLLRLLAVANLPGPSAFGVLHDPETLTAAFAAGRGREFRADLGGRATTAFGPPVPLRVKVERLIEPGQAWGDGAGAMAVLRYGSLAILVAERRPAHVGVELFQRAGVRPEALQLLALKAGAAPEPDWAGRFPELLACDLPGPASPSLAQLPFSRVARRRLAP